MIKLIAIDLDGTLLTSEKNISEETKKAICQADEKGIHVVLCTGRPIMGIREFLKELHLLSPNHYCITFNGGLAQITATEEIIAQKVHTLEDVQFIYNALFKVGLPLNAIDLQYVYEPTYPSDAPSHYGTIIKNLTFVQKEFDTFDQNHVFNKALSCYEESELDAKIAKLPSEIKENYTFLKSRPVLMEILPKGVDKAYGLSKLCEHLNIAPKEVMAIGDEENDLAMIAYAGIGVAMGNATDMVKKVADVVTETNDQEGVAKAIYQYALRK